MDITTLKFFLKLYDCRNHRAYLSSPSFKTFKNKEKLCQELATAGLIDFTREIATVTITPSGEVLLGLPLEELPISEKELKVLQKINKSSTIAISNIKLTFQGKSLKSSERYSILERFCDRGWVSVTTKRKQKGCELWITEKGLECLAQVNDFFLSWGKSSQAVRETQPNLTPNLSEKPTDEEVLQIILDLDKQLNTDNYLPIFHLREKLQPPLSREELDQILYRLQEKDKIEMSTLAEVKAYNKEEIDSGIPQPVGGALFFIIVN